MGDQVHVAPESQAALSAPEGLMTRVFPLVSDEQPQPGEGFGTVVAFKGSADLMDVLAVAEQRLEDGEGLVTAGAVERRVGGLVSF